MTSGSLRKSGKKVKTFPIKIKNEGLSELFDYNKGSSKKNLVFCVFTVKLIRVI